jgi:hypothetical protein
MHIASCSGVYVVHNEAHSAIQMGCLKYKNIVRVHVHSPCSWSLQNRHSPIDLRIGSLNPEPSAPGTHHFDLRTVDNNKKGRSYEDY